MAASWFVSVTSTTGPTNGLIGRPAVPADVLRPGRRLPVGLGAALAAVTAAAGAVTAFVPDLLRGPQVMQGSARGTALVMLFLGVPLVLLGLAAARRGSARGILVWLGATAYLVYNAVMLLFATPVNPAFLLYVGVLGLGIGSLVALLRTLDVLVVAGRVLAGIGDAARDVAVLRIVAGYVGTVAVLNALVWLKVVVPGLTQDDPGYLQGTGLTTNPLYVQDLAFWLPMAGLVAAWLWRMRPEGVVLGGALLVMWFAEAVTVTVDQWLGHRADPASTVASAGGSVLFVVLAVVDLVPLLLLLAPRRRPTD